MSDSPSPSLPGLLRRLSEVSVVRFGVVGCSNMLIGFSIFWSASHVLRVWLAQALSYAAGMVWSYFWNRKWTFKTQGDVAGEAGRFFGLQIGFLLLSSALMKLLVESQHVQKALAWLLVSAFVTVLNFVASRYWAFKAA